MPKLIPLSSKDFDEKMNSPQHRISVDDAREMVALHKKDVRQVVENHRQQNGKPLTETHSVWFSKKVIDALFDPEIGCDGVRIYFGSHVSPLSDGRDNSRNKDKTCTILVGTKEVSNPGNPSKPINEDQISDSDKMAISMLSRDDVIYDLGTMCPDECDGTKL